MKQPDRAIVAALDSFMRANGFKYIGSRGGYYRKYTGGFDFFSWGSYPLATGERWPSGYYEGHYGLGLRCDAIDDISSAVMPLYGAGNQQYATTVYRAVGWRDSLFAFDPKRDRELCLRFDQLEKDVAEMVDRIEAMLGSDGWNWYSRYADPAVLSRDINEPVGGPVPHPLVNNSTQRPLVGVAAACVGEPKRVPEWIERWLSTSRSWDEQYADLYAPKTRELASKFDLIVSRARSLGYKLPGSGDYSYQNYSSDYG